MTQPSAAPNRLPSEPSYSAQPTFGFSESVGAKSQSATTRASPVVLSDRNSSEPDGGATRTIVATDTALSPPDWYTRTFAPRKIGENPVLDDTASGGDDTCWCVNVLLSTRASTRDVSPIRSSAGTSVSRLSVASSVWRSCAYAVSSWSRPAPMT